MQEKARGEEGWRVEMVHPEGAGEHGHQQYPGHAEDLAPDERAQRPVGALRTLIPEDALLERLLPRESGTEGLPFALEVVEFHRGFLAGGGLMEACLEAPDLGGGIARRNTKHVTDFLVAVAV